jgi:hypothetical protein
MNPARPEYPQVAGKTYSLFGQSDSTSGYYKTIRELTFGMRCCRSKGILVVGIPLDANRCIRWFGEFFPYSVDIDELERLVSGVLRA